jgi:hemerythrin
MPITWREDMSVGVEEIDNQHKYLICLINTIEAGVNCHLEKKLFVEQLSQLEAYTHFHFDHEENLQIQSKFPHYESNKNEHNKLIQNLNEIVGELKSGEDVILRAKDIGSLFEILREWLLDHILVEDMKMKDFFGKDTQS